MPPPRSFFTFFSIAILIFAFTFTGISHGAALPDQATTISAHFGAEQAVIDQAAVRNHCTGDLRLVLYAIRKAESGGPGNEFGVKSPDATDLNSQAGWAAATVVKSYKRFLGSGGRAGDMDSFIEYLSNRYCPTADDPVGHSNWITNVRHWYERLK